MSSWHFNPIYIQLKKKIEELIPEMSEGIVPLLLKLIRMCEEFVEEHKGDGSPGKTSVTKSELEILLKLGLQKVSTGDFDGYNCILCTFSNERHVYLDLPAELIQDQYSIFKNHQVTVNIQDYYDHGKEEGIIYTNTQYETDGAAQMDVNANFTDRGFTFAQSRNSVFGSTRS